jgi:hypothetical protein
MSPRRRPANTATNTRRQRRSARLMRMPTSSSSKAPDRYRLRRQLPDGTDDNTFESPLRSGHRCPVELFRRALRKWCGGACQGDCISRPRPLTYHRKLGAAIKGGKCWHLSCVWTTRTLLRDGNGECIAAHIRFGEVGARNVRHDQGYLMCDQSRNGGAKGWCVRVCVSEIPPNVMLVKLFG